METHFDISSGGVIYRLNAGRAEICLIAVQGGERWQIPKGHVDRGESVEEAAVREVREETGLVGRPLERLDKIDYWFWSNEGDEKIRHHKIVYFHLLEYAGGDTADHDAEVDDARWFPIEEAVEKLTFDTERQVARRAAERIRERTGGS